MIQRHRIDDPTTSDWWSNDIGLMIQRHRIDDPTTSDWQQSFFKDLFLQNRFVYHIDNIFIFYHIDNISKNKSNHIGFLPNPTFRIQDDYNKSKNIWNICLIKLTIFLYKIHFYGQKTLRSEILERDRKGKMKGGIGWKLITLALNCDPWNLYFPYGSAV